MFDIIGEIRLAQTKSDLILTRGEAEIATSPFPSRQNQPDSQVKLVVLLN